MSVLPDPLPEWALLDPGLMDEPPTAPVYHVAGLIEAGSVVMLAGDSGTAKSTIARALAIATVQGGRWLGRDVKRGRVVYVHAEDGPRLTVRRLRALGWRSMDTGLHYWCRVPMLLREAAHRSALRDEVEEHGAKLLVLDSVVMLSGLDVNDNAGAAELMGWLGSLAMDLDCVVVAVHHESKSGVVSNRSTSTAAKALLGAGQWRAQCDLQMSLELTTSPRGPREETPEGSVDTWRVRLRFPKEREFGDGPAVEDVVVWSLKRDAALMRMEVRAEAPTPTTSKPPATVRMVDALRDGPLTEVEWGVAVGLKPGTGSWKRNVQTLLSASTVGRRADGRFEVQEVSG